jgi:hypothetical protein
MSESSDHPLFRKMDQGEILYPEGGQIADVVAPERVIEIDPEGRYIVVVPEDVTMADAQKMAEVIKGWWESGDRFLWMRGDVVLIRIREDA